MVSLGKIGFAFLCTPRFNHRHKNIQHTNKYTRITPVNVKIPFIDTFETYRSDTDHLIQDLTNKAFDFLNIESSEWDHGNKLSRLNLDKRTLVLKEIVTRWTDEGPDFTVNNLYSFKDIVKSLELSLEDVYKTLLEILNLAKNKLIPPKVCLLCDVYKPNKKEREHFDTSNTLVKEENIDLYRLVQDIKSTIITKEFEKILDDELKEYRKTNPPHIKKVETNYEMSKLRKVLSKECPDYTEKITAFSNKKLIDHSIKLKQLLWEIEFYNNFSMVEIPEFILESVKEDSDFGTLAFNNLIYSRVIKLKNLIKNIINPSEEVHILDIHTYYLQKQYEYSLEKFNEWQENSRQKLNKLREYGYDLNRDYIKIKNIKEVGGGMPPINVTPICPEYPKLVESDHLEEEFRVIEKPSKEEKKQFLKDMEKTRERMRALSHMTVEEKSEFMMRKVPGEIKLSRKAKERRMRIRELNNPFKTSEDLPPFDELKDKIGYGDNNTNNNNEKHMNITPNLTKEEVDDILSEINTDYIRHNMNIKNIEWHMKSARINPRRSLENILKSGQDVKNPESKKITFEGDEFNETFEWISEFVEDQNTEIHKYRRKLYNSINNNSKEYKDNNTNNNNNKDNKWSCNSGDIILKSIKRPSKYLPEDPEASADDDPIIEDLLKYGASLNCLMKWPYMELTPNPTQSQMETNFYRMSISQPHPIYRCKKCDYRIFSQPVITYNNKRINPVEYNEFINEEDYVCKNCNSDKTNFEEIWPTGEAKYDLPHMVKKVKEQQEKLDEEDM